MSYDHVFQYGVLSEVNVFSVIGRHSCCGLRNFKGLMSYKAKHIIRIQDDMSYLLELVD